MVSLTRSKLLTFFLVSVTSSFSSWNIGEAFWLNTKSPSGLYSIGTQKHFSNNFQFPKSAFDDKPYFRNLITDGKPFTLRSKNPDPDESKSNSDLVATLIGAIPSNTILSKLFILGFFLGPALDGLQSRVELTVYDFGAVDIPLGFGILKTNYFVFPLLGLYFAIGGALFLMFDAVIKAGSKSDVESASERDEAASAIISIGSCAATLYTSSLLYEAHVPQEPTYLILAAWSILAWVAADRSFVGIILGVFCGILSPIIEIFLMDVFKLWHYPEADFYFIGENGVASFVVFCYFVFTVMVGALSRFFKVQK